MSRKSIEAAIKEIQRRYWSTNGEVEEFWYVLGDLGEASLRLNGLEKIRFHDRGKDYISLDDVKKLLGVDDE